MGQFYLILEPKNKFALFLDSALTLFRIGNFDAALGLLAPSLKSLTYILQLWNLAQLYLT